MKLMHVGDLHFGKSLGDFDLTDDQEYLLKQLLEIVDNRSVDAILIAGDVYDKKKSSKRPYNTSVKMLRRRKSVLNSLM